MSRWIASVAAMAAAVALAAPALTAADEGQEEPLLSVLRSNAAPAQKDAACARLKQIGTARAAAVLAALLADEQLSHSARYALESMPCPEAGEALLAALGKTTGAMRAGIISSLGNRRQRQAAGALAALLGDGDATTAAAAATALGKIGGPEAAGALKAATAKAPAGVRPAVVDGLLLCADGMLAGGEAQAAAAIYRGLCESKERAHVRTAACRGLVLSAGEGGVALVTAALTGDDEPARVAALDLLRELKAPKATEALAAALPRAAPAVQAAMIQGLAQRGDVAAAPAVMAAAKSSAPAVRTAALDALADLGDASAVALLAESAASGEGDEQKAARRSLARLRRGDVRQAILDYLPKAAPAAQMELVRALSQRRDAQALPTLLKMLDAPAEPIRLAALRAVGSLGDETAAGKLVAMLTAATSDDLRQAAEDALTSIAARSKQPQTMAGEILSAMAGTGVEARCALLRVAGRIGGPDALKALRAGAAGSDPAVRDAAIRAMAGSSGAEAADDLLRLATGAASPVHRVLAIRGYWRVVGLAGDRPAAQRLEMCRAGLAAAGRPEDKRPGLAELANVPLLDALKLAESLCADEAIRPEAETACVRIAASLASAHPAEAKAALRRLAAESKTDTVRAQAAKALDAMDQYVGYVTAWSVCGPYRLPGKECSQLFDIAVGPELPGSKADWKPLRPPADASLFWQADLGGMIGGDHALAYLKSRVYCPRAQRVRLEIGTDDGVKVWVNGELAHANNAIRGLTPGQDNAQADLKEGWNDLLLKITQHTLGCGACVRIRSADGGTIEGLRFEPGGQ